MTRVLTTIHLSDIQREVLAKVKAAENPHMAWGVLQQTSDDVNSNFASARDTLGNLGFLKVGDGEVEVTPTGEEEMQKENLIDETGELTDVGQQLASVDRDENPNSAQPDQMQQDGEMDMDLDMDFGDEGDDFDMDLEGDFKESFSLLRQINNQATIMEDQRKLKKRD